MGAWEWGVLVPAWRVCLCDISPGYLLLPVEKYHCGLGGREGKSAYFLTYPPTSTSPLCCLFLSFPPSCSFSFFQNGLSLSLLPSPTFLPYPKKPTSLTPFPFVLFLPYAWYNEATTFKPHTLSIFPFTILGLIPWSNCITILFLMTNCILFLASLLGSRICNVCTSFSILCA